MLINNALMGGESEVAMSWSRRLAQYPTLLPTGAYGDASADWDAPPARAGIVNSSFTTNRCESLCWSHAYATPGYG